ncbi:hypothetical protein V6N12_075660 [Hibiscus sabdariffa]|uniref:Uncharacterized protein n=1 Tax=Hibiscus sabdariffa TaxID=183260 RepID=A0ABR2C888_9ROSI
MPNYTVESSTPDGVERFSRRQISFSYALYALKVIIVRGTYCRFCSRSTRVGCGLPGHTGKRLIKGASHFETEGPDYDAEMEIRRSGSQNWKHGSPLNMTATK